MIWFIRSLKLTLVAGTLSAAVCSLAQQAADPAPDEGVEAGDAGDEADEAAADEADATEAGAPPAKGQQPAKAPAAPGFADDPAVQSILKSNPSTPDGWVKASSILADLGHPAAAMDFIRKLAEANLGGDALGGLVEKHGSAPFVKMGLEPAWQPQGKQLADAALGAFKAISEDPARIAAAVGGLSAARPTDFAAAVARLGRAQELGLQALLKALADPARGADHGAIRRALVVLGPAAARPTAAALEAADESLQIQAAHVLGAMAAAKRLGSADARREYCLALYGPALAPEISPELRAAARSALVKILGRVPGVERAVADLKQTADKAFTPPDLRGEEIVLADPPRMREVWEWDSATSTPLKRVLADEQAALRAAVRCARDAYRLSLENRALLRLWMALELEVAAGAEDPLAEMPVEPGSARAAAEAQGPAALLDVLELSDARGRPASAALAARLLGELDQPEILHGGGVRPSPLVRAMESRHRAVRFHATRALMRLGPAKPYAGASRLMESIEYFVASHGAPRALAAHAVGQEARRQAALLAALGYEAEAVADRRSLLETAIAAPNYELILVDIGLATPLAGQIIQQLRRDSRTSTAAICIVGHGDELERAERIARQEPLVRAIVRPLDSQALAMQTRSLLAAAARHRASPEDRLAQALEALDWLDKLAEARNPMYDFSRVEQTAIDALSSPALSTRAAAVLARFGSRRSQLTLAEYASRQIEALPHRQAALRSLGANLSRYGNLLTLAEIERQYDRYNASEGQAVEHLAILSRILDLIEARADVDRAPALVDKSFDE